MSEELREVSDEQSFAEVKEQPLALLYKHSTRCPIAFGAKSEVDRFAAKNLSVPIYMVNVVVNRDFSRRIAEDLGVKHESPQAILLRSGEAIKHTSHRRITAQLLEEWVAEEPA